jgi:hypothetical protein
MHAATQPGIHTVPTYTQPAGSATHLLPQNGIHRDLPFTTILRQNVQPAAYQHHHRVCLTQERNCGLQPMYFTEVSLLVTASAEARSYEKEEKEAEREGGV